jgi:hypothetical protein
MRKPNSDADVVSIGSIPYGEIMTLIRSDAQAKKVRKHLFVGCEYSVKLRELTATLNYHAP